MLQDASTPCRDARWDSRHQDQVSVIKLEAAPRYHYSLLPETGPRTRRTPRPGAAAVSPRESRAAAEWRSGTSPAAPRALAGRPPQLMPRSKLSRSRPTTAAAAPATCRLVYPQVFAREVPHTPGLRFTTSYIAKAGLRVDFVTPNEGPDTDTPQKLPALQTELPWDHF